MMHSTTQPRVRHVQPSWLEAMFQQCRTNKGALLLAAGATAICLFVAFIAVLQGAVERGESFRQQLSLGSSLSQPTASSFGAATNNGAVYSTRFDITQRSLGAPLAPALMFVAHGNR